MLHVGLIDYLNALPFTCAFRQGILEPGCTLTYGVPTHLNALLRQGRLDAGLVSSIEYLEGGHTLFSDFGIAARQHILSVNLYLQNDLRSLHQKKIGLCAASATSVSLLKVLCHHVWNVSPHFEPLNLSQPLSSYEGILLIGDEALKQDSLPGFHTIDLARAWVDAMQLPFVFAVFAVRSAIMTEKKQEIDLFYKRLQAALNWAENNPEDILKAAASCSGLSITTLKTYYTLCSHRLGKKDWEGLSLFNKLRQDVQ